MIETTSLPSRPFLRLAALGACLYVAAQVFQWVVVAFLLPTAIMPEEAILYRLLPLERARAILLLLSFPAVLIAYAGVALWTFRRAPGAAVLGLVFASVFVAFELAYRSVDFFVVTQQWALQLQDGTAIASSARLTERAAAWQELVAALYFPLLLAHGLASASLGVAVWSKADRFDQVMSVLLILNAVRAFGRLLATHAGISGLDLVNSRIYLPITVALFGFMGFWLWKKADRSRAHDLGDPLRPE